MNDFMEVRHGLNCLLKTYSSAAGDRFKLTLDNLFHTGGRLFESIAPFPVARTSFPTAMPHDYGNNVLGMHLPNIGA